MGVLLTVVSELGWLGLDDTSAMLSRSEYLGCIEGSRCQPYSIKVIVSAYIPGFPEFS